MSELARERKIRTKYIPFFTQTTNLIDKDFGKNPIYLKEMRLEGDLSSTDKTTVTINAEVEEYYGKFCIYPDKDAKQLIVTPAFNANRSGILVLIYEGKPFKTTYVGFDADLNLLIARGKSVVAGYGQRNVPTAGTRVQLDTAKTRVVEIRAKKTNTGYIYVGDSSVSSSNGYILSANDTIQLPVDASILYIDASVNGEGVSWIGWR